MFVTTLKTIIDLVFLMEITTCKHQTHCSDMCTKYFEVCMV